MGAFKQLLADHQLTPEALQRLSHQLEAWQEEDKALARERFEKRRDKERKDKPYAELGIGKPRSGRGVSEQQLKAALEDVPLPTKVRGKLLRVVNAALEKKGAKPVDMKALFGEVLARKGEASKAKAA